MTSEQYQLLLKQGTSIALTAAVAAGFAFLQSIAASQGISCQPVANPAVAAGLGGSLKVALNAIQIFTGRA